MKSWWEYLPDYPVDTGPLTVYEREPIDTGLIDCAGRRIYRSPEPIGFLRKSAKENQNQIVTAKSAQEEITSKWRCRIGKVRWK